MLISYFYCIFLIETSIYNYYIIIKQMTQIFTSNVLQKFFYDFDIKFLLWRCIIKWIIIKKLMYLYKKLNKIVIIANRIKIY